MMRRKGFLLLEMMVVIALLALMSCMSMSIMHYYDRYLVRLELERLYATVMLLHHYALSTGQDQELIVDTTAHYYVTLYSKEFLTGGVKFGVPPRVKGPPSSPVTVLTKPVTFDRNRIVCYANGVIAAGTIYMINRVGNYVCALSSGVAQEPYIRCYDYQGKWILLR
jgi:prepilin-type N-terminal cleavage/methylation domain-containing protein